VNHPQPTLTLQTGAATGMTLYGWECPCGARACVLYATSLGAQVSALRHLAAKHRTASIETQKVSTDEHRQ
jgi:hypothetical protein